MNKKMLIEKFNENAKEAKNKAEAVIKEVNSLLKKKEGNFVKITPIDLIPVDDILEFKNKVQNIIDTDITYDNIPSLDGINNILIFEFLELEEIITNLMYIKSDIMILS